VVPLIHSRQRVEQLLARKSAAERFRFYDSVWNNLRWRALFRIFFSRLVSGRLGRDPEFFRYVEGKVAERILERMRYAMTELEPATNPYLYWIFKGQHRDGALPFALRAENFEAIRAHLDRLEWHCCSLEQFLVRSPAAFDAFNLSDIFEYLSVESYERLLRLIIGAAKPKARLAYWNLLVPRTRPESLAAFLKPLKQLSDRLFARDKAFFYSAFVVEEVLCTSL
jgi:S-adenosylmethionine-diacylglycerol 3-amino-3-carboxypropyl transferase